MLTINGTDGWRAAHPGAVIGLLELAEVENNGPSPALDQLKRQIEAQLRQQYDGFDRKAFLALPVMAAYERYYRRFDNTYHVLLQLESLVLKGKNLPEVSPLVDANFAAEMDTLVLTAGHDADRLVEPVVIDTARPGDQMTQMSGKLKAMRVGDMLMSDRGGVCCSILYGQDHLSPITAATQHVLYVAYAPTGVGTAAVMGHLQQIEANIRLFAPQARLEQRKLLCA
jgi:DNA/RNA-binding domain of Phe-tRNA-synthetase-like protein